MTRISSLNGNGIISFLPPKQSTSFRIFDLHNMRYAILRRLRLICRREDRDADQRKRTGVDRISKRGKRNLKIFSILPIDVSVQ